MGSRFDSCEERGREIIEKLSKKTEPITGKAAESVSKVGKCVADKANDVNGFVREIADDTRKKARKVAIDARVFIQYDGKEVEVEDIIAKAEDAYRVSGEKPLKKINVYIKPDENAAYYVINDTVIGQIDL